MKSDTMLFCTCVFTAMQHCGIHQFECANGFCVPLSTQCDHFDDCGDNSDEQGCGKDNQGHFWGQEFCCSLVTQDGKPHFLFSPFLVYLLVCFLESKSGLFTNLLPMDIEGPKVFSCTFIFHSFSANWTFWPGKWLFVMSPSPKFLCVVESLSKHVAAPSWHFSGSMWVKYAVVCRPADSFKQLLICYANQIFIFLMSIIQDFKRRSKPNKIIKCFNLIPCFVINCHFIGP